MVEETKKETNGSKPKKENAETQSKEETAKPKCGIIMPISETDGCSAQHWLEVLAILQEAIKSAGFIGNLVSDSDEISVIHKTIVNNVYHSEIAVCDISGKNPNVMFELGLRLAFDKPTIIIKDEVTPFTFDTSLIEQLIYPRDLNYHRMNEFKEKLRHKINVTYEVAQNNPDYSPFLKNFGEFTVAKIESNEVTQDVFILESMRDLKSEMSSIRQFLRSTLRANDFNFNDLVARKNLRESHIAKSFSQITSANFYFESKDALEKAERVNLHITNELNEFYPLASQMAEYDGGYRLDFYFPNTISKTVLEDTLKPLFADKTLSEQSRITMNSSFS